MLSSASRSQGSRGQGTKRAANDSSANAIDRPRRKKGRIDPNKDWLNETPIKSKAKKVSQRILAQSSSSASASSSSKDKQTKTLKKKKAKTKSSASKTNIACANAISQMPFLSPPEPINVSKIQNPGPKVSDQKEEAFGKEALGTSTTATISLETLKQLAEKLSVLSFEERMKSLKGRCSPIYDLGNNLLGLGFKVSIPNTEPGKAPKIFQMTLNEGDYESEIIDESSFPENERSKTHHYLKGFEETNSMVDDEKAAPNLKIRLSPFNGEITNVARGKNFSGNEIATIVKAVSPIFKGRPMYLFDDAKKYFPGVKTSEKKRNYFYIKGLAIQDKNKKTWYERIFGVIPAKIKDWKISNKNFEANLTQDPEKYLKDLEYLSNVTFAKIYKFYSPLHGGSNSGKIERICKKVFGKKFVFATSEMKLSELVEKLQSRTQDKALAEKEAIKAQEDMLFINHNLLEPWKVEGNINSHYKDAIVLQEEYLKALTTVAETRVFVFPE